MAHLFAWLGVLQVVTASSLAAGSSVPYLRQVNDYCCGCASAAMVLGALFPSAPDVDQRDLARVMRTTNRTGTLVTDVARGLSLGPVGETCVAGVGCSLTDTTGLSVGPLTRTTALRGFPSRGYGVRAMVHRPGVCWLEGLRRLVVEDGLLPVLLQRFSDTDHGGHFRVLVAVEEGPEIEADAPRRWVMHDPWDRDGQPRIVRFSDDEMCRLWNKTEELGVGGVVLPSHGAVVPVPWEVSVRVAAAAGGDNDEGSAVVVEATVSVPCPAPLNCSSFDALLSKDANENEENDHVFGEGGVSIPHMTSPVAIIDVPPTHTLANDETDVTKPLVLTRQPADGGAWTGSVSWRVVPGPWPRSDVEPSPNATFSVTALGPGTGESSTRDPWPGYPQPRAYLWTELVGGRGSSSLDGGNGLSSPSPLPPVDPSPQPHAAPNDQWRVPFFVAAATLCVSAAATAVLVFRARSRRPAPGPYLLVDSRANAIPTNA